MAAFFGFGAYVAGLLAKHGIITEPLLALCASGLAAAALGFLTSFLVLRGSDLTRIMVTLGVALVLREIANRYAWLTGGADGLQGVEMKPLLGLYRFDMFGHTAYCYALVVLFALFLAYAASGYVVWTWRWMRRRKRKQQAVAAAVADAPREPRIDPGDHGPTA